MDFFKNPPPLRGRFQTRDNLAKTLPLSNGEGLRTRLGLLRSSTVFWQRFHRYPDAKTLLNRDANAPDWINWPVLLSAAERAWHLAEELCAADLEPEIMESEVALVMGPVFERLVRARWMYGTDGMDILDGMSQLGFPKPT